MVDAIEQKLNSSDGMWLGGQQPSKDDAEQFTTLGASPALSVATHPNVFAWYTLVGRFSEEVRGSWTEASAAPAQAGAGKKKGKGAA